ncbi:hypothetical protein P3T27_003398 [Kitasatospora sp. MAA19]|uniref:DUF5133 domain-containing protein n=1 Tax=unclassified Kitasatospora TaxID=2633591 RepID=UPI0024758532|nr:DUF5133 domain-containing protein [Kitasatospora sp. MAA19]MDH6706671.1 hypothetical protein [Kitasatospora sp. MAA19]
MNAPDGGRTTARRDQPDVLDSTLPLVSRAFAADRLVEALGGRAQERSARRSARAISPAPKPASPPLRRCCSSGARRIHVGVPVAPGPAGGNHGRRSAPAPGRVREGRVWMSLIDFSALRRLVAEADVLTRDPRVPTTEAERRLADVYYTICVYIGLRDPAQALEQARRLLAEQQPLVGTH